MVSRDPDQKSLVEIRAEQLVEPGIEAIRERSARRLLVLHEVRKRDVQQPEPGARAAVKCQAELECVVAEVPIVNRWSWSIDYLGNSINFAEAKTDVAAGADAAAKIAALA